jgi:hypothetical protein
VIVKADTRINGTAGFGEAEQSIPNRAEAFFANSRQHLEKKSNEVHVYTGAIRLEKTESSGEKLDGVCFELYTKNKETYDPVIRRDGKVLTEKDEGYDPDGEVWQVVTKDGAAEFCGLGEDDGTKSRTYYLKEVRTAGAHSPAGAYLPVNLRRGLANGGKPVVVCNDPVQLLYAGGRGRLFFCLPAAAAAVVSAALLLRRKKKRKIVKR